MSDALNRLVELAEIDRERTAIREQLERYPRMLAEMDRDEAEQRSALEQARKQAEAAALARREAEKMVLSLRQKIEHLSGQQATVQSNKQYEALEHEIEAVSKKIDDQETIGLEQLETEEEAREAETEAARRLEKLENENSEERERIAGRQYEKQQRLERLESEREDVAPRLPADLGEDYELLLERHPGSACVPISGKNCSACGWSLVAGVLQAAHKGKITRCDNCRRFIYDREVVLKS